MMANDLGSAAALSVASGVVLAFGLLAAAVLATLDRQRRRRRSAVAVMAVLAVAMAFGAVGDLVGSGVGVGLFSFVLRAALLAGAAYAWVATAGGSVAVAPRRAGMRIHRRAAARLITPQGRAS